MQLVTEENITDLAVERWATARDPRLAELMTALVRHLHDFAREVRLTEAEWMAAIQWLNRAGQISNEKREEFILASDVVGLSMLVVQMNHRLDPGATPATVLGPFHIEGSPELGVRRRTCPRGCPARRCTLHGAVTRPRRQARAGRACSTSGRPTTRALYESQHADVDEARLRAQVHDPRGRQLLRAHDRADGLHDPDGRPGRRPDLADRDQPLPAGARALPAQRAGLRAADHAPVRGGRRVPRQRRRLRHQGGARRPVREAGARARRRTAARSTSRGSRRATTSCCSRRPEHTDRHYRRPASEWRGWTRPAAGSWSARPSRACSPRSGSPTPSAPSSSRWPTSSAPAAAPRRCSSP